MKPSRTQAFTLIELLVVIAIIAVLASLVLSGAGFVQKKGARSRAEAEIVAIGGALERYKSDNGDYPTNSTTGSDSNLVTALMPTNGGKIYFEFKTKDLTNGSYLDPFGYSYNYIYTNGAPFNGTNNYDLWSVAGSSNNPTNTWIKNW